MVLVVGVGRGYHIKYSLALHYLAIKASVMTSYRNSAQYCSMTSSIVVMPLFTNTVCGSNTNTVK